MIAGRKRPKIKDSVYCNPGANPKWSKIMRSTYWLVFVLVAVVVTGCGGIRARKSVSPLDFILPGLHIKYDLPVIPTATNAMPLVAQAP